VADKDIIPLKPLDEADERRRAEHLRRLRELEEPLRAERADRPHVPLAHREDLTAADLEHFVVNYCLDSHHFHVDRLEAHVRDLRRFGALGRRAVLNFIEGRAREAALDAIDEDELDALFHELLERL
jgi:hypothetical protein